MSIIPKDGRILITGASSGIGEAYAIKLAGRGHKLSLLARRKDRLEALAQRLRSDFGADAEIIVADLEDAAQLGGLEERLARDDFSGVINNAGAGGLGFLAGSSTQSVERTVTLNIVALTRLSRAALIAFKRKNAGLLVNIGSVLAHAPSPGGAIYSGSKAFVLNFTRSLQMEFAETDVRIQLVMPGPVRSEFFSSQGMDGSVFPAAAYLSADELVEAALAGLENRELVTVPSLPDVQSWERLETIRREFLAATMSGKVADRYRAGDPALE